MPHPHPLTLFGALLLAATLTATGCRPQANSDAAAEPDPAVAKAESESESDRTSPAQPEAPEATAEAVSVKPREYELDAQKILAARLPGDLTQRGWVRLFDTQTLYGWKIIEPANWRVEADALVVDAGEISFLSTSSVWQDFELSLQFKADPDTNSGVFIRSPLSPNDPATDCYEINIAGPEHPFPTGSLVERQAAEPLPDAWDADAWHTMRLTALGDTITVEIDGSVVCTYEDPKPLGPGRIALQHNSGRVAFRDVRIRPLGFESLLAEEDLGQWKQYPDMDGEFTLDDEARLQVRGGRGQLESSQNYGDFILHTRFQTHADDLNSGIFFRCIPGEQMNGYECQISNATKNDDPLQPADCGTGGIFRRQNARLVAGEDQQWCDVVLLASGPNIMAWVNGIQVSDWIDPREPDPNPRRGKRLEPGTLMIQAHDPTTDLTFSHFQITPLNNEESPRVP